MDSVYDVHEKQLRPAVTESIRGPLSPLLRRGFLQLIPSGERFQNWCGLKNYVSALVFT